ncbi:2-methylaconitate cis-trans isomerase PrpF [Pseudomonas sp. TNT11]|uniref:2-methylaconitate cis-trans isomerase PrpF n=2 Tax=Pseudomonas TaxID=286 RepID=A0ABT0ERP5_9PSED|nr:2-methylaconitate cis-trans isomerase PrpF [Pseudomonas emilianonis]
MQGINKRLAQLTASGLGVGIEVTRVDVQSSLPSPAVNAFNAVLTASQQADKAVANARTDAEKLTQTANQQADRLVQVAHAQASERLANAQAQTATVASLAQVKDPGLLLRLYRERLPKILGQAGSVTTVDPARVPHNGVAVVRIWQANIGKTIIAHVPITDGAVQETGDFELDGVTFPAAEVQLEFMDPAAEEEGGGGSMFPTGNLIDDLEVPGIGTFKATLINAGIPTIFINAEDLGYTGTELQGAINGDPKALAMFETVRAHGALRMGLIKHLDEAAQRQHTPKVAFVAKPADYVASSGKAIKAGDIDLLVRALSMGKLHHAMMGTAAVAIGTAAAISGTLVNLAAGGVERNAVRFGHPSGTLRVGAEATQVNGEWVVKKAIMSRSARVLMEGFVRVPGDAF